jgi:hypothetical protein
MRAMRIRRVLRRRQFFAAGQGCNARNACAGRDATGVLHKQQIDGKICAMT